MTFFYLKNKPMAKLIWITGLSGSGKTTYGKEVYRRMKIDNINTVFLDGDTYRDLFESYGYSREDRLLVAKNLIKITSLLISQNINVVCCTISLFKEIHLELKNKFKKCVIVFISCKFEELLKRDQKGLYSCCQKGEISNVVGVDIDFDLPTQPFISIDNTFKSNLKFNLEDLFKKLEL